MPPVQRIDRRAASREDVPLAVRAPLGWRDRSPPSNHTPFRGEPTDVGVLTHPAHRGRGHGTTVARGRHRATPSAGFGLARVPGLATNAAVPGHRRRPGFEDRFDQLAIRPAH